MIGFPDQYYDTETGLSHNWWRDYDPATDRYLEFDPIGLAGGLNGYIYANANPLSNIDPDGLAYFAKRPLQRMPWMGSLSCSAGSMDDKLNTEISHEHIFFEDGKSPSNIGFGAEGLFTEKSPSGYRCNSGKYNDCVMRKAVANTPPRSYCLLGKRGDPGAKNNCQDWADQVRREYSRLINDESVKCECGLK